MSQNRRNFLKSLVVTAAAPSVLESLAKAPLAAPVITGAESYLNHTFATESLFKRTLVGNPWWRVGNILVNRKGRKFYVTDASEHAYTVELIRTSNQAEPIDDYELEQLAYVSSAFMETGSERGHPITVR